MIQLVDHDWDNHDEGIDDGFEDAGPRVTVIIPAAGSGTRMGSAVRKQFLELGGESILLRTLRMMRRNDLVQEIVIAVHPDDEARIREEEWEAWSAAGASLIVAGGESRADSVWAALQVSDPTADVVAVHDAVRPFAPVPMCRALCKLAQKRGVAVPVCPVSDTIKRVEGDVVIETPRRMGLVGVQTPQVVRRDLFVDAYEYILTTGGLGASITDDASIVEAFGHEVAVMLGSPWNIKLTRPEDLKLAEAMIAAGLVI